MCGIKFTWPKILALAASLAALALISACGVNRAAATPTPTKTPRPVAQAVNTVAATSAPPTLALPTATTEPATAVPPTATSTAEPSPDPTVEPSATVQPTQPPPAATPVPAPTRPPPPPTFTPAPQVDFVIAELRVLGQGENNGGIEGIGAGRTIFITVLDAAGNPLDGAVIVNTAGYPGQAVSGDKGPGKAEILMDREVFRLKVESVGGAAVSSETSHNMSLVDPLPQDIAGKLGDTCPTVDNCPLPPWKHFSYVIAFRRTH